MCLGTTPGPILLGAIIDSACSVWQVSCGNTGSCWTYRKFDLGLRLIVWFASLKLLGVIFAFISYKAYVPPPSEENKFDDFTKTVEVPSITGKVDKKETVSLSTKLWYFCLCKWLYSLNISSEFCRWEVHTYQCSPLRHFSAGLRLPNLMWHHTRIWYYREFQNIVTVARL